MDLMDKKQFALWGKAYIVCISAAVALFVIGGFSSHDVEKVCVPLAMTCILGNFILTMMALWSMFTS